MIKCTQKHYSKLMKYLNEDVIYNTFIIADIQNHGFNKDYQQIYMQTDDDDNCTGVFLKYYNNLILSSNADDMEIMSVLQLVDDSVNIIMGKSAIIKKIHEIYSNQTKKSRKEFYNEKKLLVLKSREKLLPENKEIRFASLEDVDKVHQFLMNIPSFQQMYSEKDMIKNRIKNHEGIHIIMEKNGEIIAHGNSAAKTYRTNMIGGVAVQQKHQGKGYGKEIVSALCENIINEHRMPCLFSDYPLEKSLYSQLGFETIGTWGTIELK